MSLAIKKMILLTKMLGFWFLYKKTLDGCKNIVWEMFQVHVERVQELVPLVEGVQELELVAVEREGLEHRVEPGP